MRNELLTRDEVLEIELDDEHWDKIKGVPKGGKEVEIVWDGRLHAIDEDYSDFGYCFELPDHEQDEGDVFIHINDATNLSGKEDMDDVFIHLYELLLLEHVKKVIFRW